MLSKEEIPKYYKECVGEIDHDKHIKIMEKQERKYNDIKQGYYLCGEDLITYINEEKIF